MTRRFDEFLSRVVHQLFAASLDLHTVLGALPRHKSLSRDRVHIAVDRLDATIAELHRVGWRLAITPSGVPLDEIAALVAALPEATRLSEYLRELVTRCAAVLDQEATAIVAGDPPRVVAVHPDEPAVWRLCARWESGEFTEEARRAGFPNVRVEPLRSEGGALVLLGVTAVPEDELGFARAAAGLAALALAHDEMVRERVRAGLRLKIALAAQAVVEQAKGALAERYAVPVAETHTALTELAVLTGMDLAAVARIVLDGADQAFRRRERTVVTGQQGQAATELSSSS